ncbi:PTS sugar transporter subunit IIA [Vagococcus sp. BWB3-3]|uniref:PTS sugar transporter subunit IIA n=1 Tax=Vagococcus allomyrinae TaxID=2794353 RepID=A0A940SVU0_9ENTE|nr:PTS sugar transporter subunit IIA [Vagococcus allomyrinae]MBP1042239.1 PTS sugar transporter subunit IIA [Vagococcus allomyrinae]
MIEFLNQKLVFLNKSYSNSDALFEDIGGEIFAKGFGTGQFVEKLKEREGNFPTGLNLGNYGVAIPHTDPEYITEQFISVATLNEPVSFKSMDNINVEVPVKLVFILGLTKAENQLLVLQKLMQVIQDEALVKGLMKEKNINDLLRTLEKNTI